MKRFPIATLLPLSLDKAPLTVVFATLIAIALATPLSITNPALAFEPEESGQIATLPPIGERWVWIPDRLLEHSFLFDAEAGKMLGTIPSTGSLTPKLPLVARSRGEIYSVDLDYARGSRGARTDYVSIYDAETLLVKGEVVLSHPTSESNTSLHHAALLEGDRFVVVFSQFPTTVASVVNVIERRVVSVVSIAGCAGVYPVGPTRFATLCGDGTVLVAVLDESGAFEGIVRSEPFFDVVEDPVSMAGVRLASSWFFVTFAGMVHEVDFSSETPVAKDAWPLASEAEREDRWRPGGLRPFALHRSTKRFYALMQQGGPGSHKDASPEIWAFDLDDRERIDRFEVPNLAADFMGQLMGLKDGSFTLGALRMLVPNAGAHALAITQDANPLLLTRNAEFGVVAVLDSASGETIRNLTEVGLSGPTLGVP
jgi:methylamine dehydrogenase heavy chain